MSLFIAIVLGLIQGLTEFIPISSTAHLTIAASLFGVIDPAHPEKWTAFMATIQMGTLAAVFVYFWRDVAQLSTATFTEVLQPWRVRPSAWSVHARQAVMVVVGTIPIVVVGLAAKNIIEGGFTKDLGVIALGLIVIGLLLWWSDKRATFHRNLNDIKLRDALTIGCAQTLALIPGASRSGTTIMAGLFRGLNREDAARFSFLLSIPSIFGAGVLEFIGELKHISWSDGGLQLLLATLAALVSGYYSIAFLMRFLRTRSVTLFVVYRLILGGVVLVTACSDPLPKTGYENLDSHGTSVPFHRSAVGGDERADTISEVTDIVVVNTTMGRFQIGLYGNEAPRTVENFLQLVNKKVYNRTLIHRVVPGFVIQMGDPTTRDPKARSEWGRGGFTATGSPLIEELDTLLPSAKRGYVVGVVAMARTPEPGSGTSQFFICLEKAATLPYQYTIFGRITEGMDVVRKISEVETEPGTFGEVNPMPRKPIIIHSIKTKNIRK